MVSAYPYINSYNHHLKRIIHEKSGCIVTIFQLNVIVLKPSSAPATPIRTNNSWRSLEWLYGHVTSGLAALGEISSFHWRQWCQIQRSVSYKLAVNQKYVIIKSAEANPGMKQKAIVVKFDIRPQYQGSDICKNFEESVYYYPTYTWLSHTSQIKLHGPFYLA